MNPPAAVHYFGSVGSTMTEAARLAEQGCPAGTAVVAAEQTAGRGRHGHSWHSEPGAGLYCSLVLRPPLDPDTMPVLMLALGLATAEAIARAANLACDLRWPNDVMLGDKKVAGVLVQLHQDAAVAGIGINVNHQAFPPDIAPLATSLRLVSGRLHSREALLAELLAAIDRFTRMLVEDGRRAILELFSQRSSYVCGKQVVVDDSLHGVTAGLDPSGFLIVRRNDGTEQLVLAGGVRAAGPGCR